MRLTKEHVGKRVRCGCGTFLVTAVGDQNALMIREGRDSEEINTVQAFCHLGWQLVEEQEKPSHRIDEILIELMDRKGAYDTVRFDAVKEYLDEEFEKRKSNG